MATFLISVAVGILENQGTSFLLFTTAKEQGGGGGGKNKSMMPMISTTTNLYSAAENVFDLFNKNSNNNTQEYDSYENRSTIQSLMNQYVGS
jgi:hypothetical protein